MAPLVFSHTLLEANAAMSLPSNPHLHSALRTHQHLLFMLLGLSVELLEEISHQLVQSDQASLRAACKGLNGTINRLFFSVLILNPHSQRQSENGVQMLQALANGDIGWSLHARTLWLRSGDHTESQKAKKRLVRDKIWDLLTSRLGLAKTDPNGRVSLNAALYDI
ncbi:hypothetical protein B0H14DRAFT_2628242 [Mycena olivaceomarginata]|nr:hypothetical protein B0H14DRAFT_2628242 [Mycena olivaceomarginata]